MRKIEHVHMHALLAEITRYLVENETMPAETLSVYDTIGTRPTSIHKSKQHHHEAHMVLGSTIESSLNETRTDDPEQSVGQ
jgi:hypothetical protein